jgi:sugar/nucleoside kinase (ribokinase family)
MTAARFDVVAIGNALVDVIAQADDAFLTAQGLQKGAMQLIDAERAVALYGQMAAGMETSGGSAANTLAGMAALGCRCAHIGQVANDQLGEVFIHDIRAVGVRFDTPASTNGEPTGRCLISVTPDGQRTMSTLLGASAHLSADVIDHDLIKQGAILYLEGYQWDPESPRAAMRTAIATARGAGRRVALTLSDGFVVDRHRADFRALLAHGDIDILFCNEAEILSFFESEDFDAAVAAISPKVPMLVVTRSENGAIAVSNGVRTAVPAEPVVKVVDTTGAGDLFAAGFLTGQAQGRSVRDSLTMGAVAAAEVISHYGPRPESDLRALMAARLG